MIEASRGGANKFKLALRRAEELRGGRGEAARTPAPQEVTTAQAPPTPCVQERTPLPQFGPPAGPKATPESAVPAAEPPRPPVVPLARLCRVGALSDHVRMLRTRVLEDLERAGGKSVLVTSPGRREGKSFTARHLAASIAVELARPTVLVEAGGDPSPALTHGGPPRGAGLAQCLSGEAPLARVLLDSDVTNLRVVPPGHHPGNHVCEPSARAVERLLRQLREQEAGALVVIDGPCVLGRGDALVFGRFVDRILLVVRAGNTRSGDARRAAELIGEQRLLGVVYNVGPG